jgi:catechol 2,3-dioxygenase-like lactoylglutathione lyase family enzyme
LEIVLKNIIDRIDHLVLTVTDIEVTTQWYEKALGFEREFFTGPEGQPRYSLRFGQLKINLQDKDTDTPTKAKVPTIGSGDFCLISAIPLDDFIAHLQKHAVAIDVGPVPRRGALGPIRSVYLRDPDNNLVEVAEYV